MRLLAVVTNIANAWRVPLFFVNDHNRSQNASAESLEAGTCFHSCSVHVVAIRA